MILSNEAKCLKCGDEIFSGSVHDFKKCSCGNIFVDGGPAYIRHGYIEAEYYMNLSLDIDDLTFETCMSALEWGESTGRNNLGKLCAIFRALRDTGYLNE